MSVTSRNPAGIDLLDRAGGARPFAGLLERLSGAVFEHVAAAAQPFIAALCAKRHGGRTWVVVPDLRVQENVFNDLVAWHGAPRFFPQLEAPAFDDILPDPEVVSERLAILHGLISRPVPESGARATAGDWTGDADRSRDILVVVADSLDEDVPAPQSIQSHELKLAVGDELALASLLGQLDAAGYERVPAVANRGQFAVRGGIVDLFSWQAAAPIRVEFFDVRIESLREFDVDSQIRTASRADAVVLLNRDDGGRSFAKLRDYIGPDDLVIALDRPECAEAHTHIVDGLWTGQNPEAPTAIEDRRRNDAVEVADTACHEHPLGSFGTGDVILQEARRNAFRSQLAEWHAAGWMAVMFFNNEGEVERFHEIFPDAAGLDCRIGQLNHGFTIPAARLAVLSDAELFGRYQHARARRLFNRERREFGRHRAIDLGELEEDGLVVHQDYGIARYRGLVKGAAAGDGGASAASTGGDEVLVLEFAARPASTSVSTRLTSFPATLAPEKKGPS